MTHLHSTRTTTVPSAVAVLYVANSHKIGGGAKVLMDLIQRLDRQQYTPFLVIPDRGPFADWAKETDVPFFVSPDDDWSSASGLFRRSLQLLGILTRTGARIVHAAAPMGYRALGVAARFARASRVCHLGFPPETGELERSFVAAPNVVIGCYEGQAKEHTAAIGRLAPKCRVVGIPNGVDLERFSPHVLTDQDRERWRFGGRQVVAILGHVSEVKGYPAFVEAAARIARVLPECRFVAVGGETTHFGYLARVREHVSSLGLEDRFHFIGFQADVAPVLRAVDVVALPSRSEGLPLAALEAMACGKAVVASAVGGIPEAIVDGESGVLISPGDPIRLADSVIELLKDPARAKNLGMAARRRIEDRFSLDGFAGRVQQVYESLLHHRYARFVQPGTVDRSRRS